MPSKTPSPSGAAADQPGPASRSTRAPPPAAAACRACWLLRLAAWLALAAVLALARVAQPALPDDAQ